MTEKRKVEGKFGLMRTLRKPKGAVASANQTQPSNLCPAATELLDPSLASNVFLLVLLHLLIQIELYVNSESLILYSVSHSSHSKEASMASPPPVTLPPDESRGNSMNIIFWAGTAISTIFVVLRLYVRIWITHSSGWDDALVSIAAFLKITGSAVCDVAIHYGFGRHIFYLTPTQLTETLYHSAISQPIIIMAYCLPKLAVVVIITRLAGTSVYKYGVHFLYFVIAVLFITSSLCFIYLFAQCDPPEHLWHPLEPARCSSPHILEDITYVGGAWSAFTDLVLAVFPATIFWSLNMKTSRRIGLSIVVGLGLLAMIAAIYKTTQLHQEEEMNATWALSSLAISTSVETDLIIICACAPVLPRLVLDLMGKGEELPTNPIYTPNGRRSGYRPFGSSENQTKSAGHEINDMELMGRV